MVRVGVVGYGVIGQRLADAISLQEDMELVGVADIAPTLAVRALKNRGMPYRLYCSGEEKVKKMEDEGIPVSGGLEELVKNVDVVLDATGAGTGLKNKQVYHRYGKKAIFQGGEKNEVAEVFFHSDANYHQGLGKKFIKVTSCNTTGLIRAVSLIDRTAGVEKATVTLIRRVADPGDTHRGLTNVLKVDPIPCYPAAELMDIMPWITCSGILVHTPVTHGHIMSIAVTPKKTLSRQAAVEVFKQHPRVMVVRIDQGFNSNASFFRFARDSLKPRGDMYEIGLWEETVGLCGKDIIFSIHIPQESVSIPESVDAVRACLTMQNNADEAQKLTNRYLGMLP